MLLHVLLIACAPTLAPPPGMAPDVDTGSPPRGVEDVGGTDFDGLAPWMFGLDAVRQVALELPADSWASLEDSPYDYVPASVTIEGERFERVAVRIKGKLGSYRPLSQKSAFRIDMNRIVPGQTYHGLQAITLNNMVNDYAQVHEVVSYDLYPRVGVPAPRVGYAWLTVNDEDFGLYAHIEAEDDNWLERVYSDPSGNLYEADYPLYPDGSYDLMDFNTTTCNLFSLEEGTEVYHEDTCGLAQIAQDTWGTDEFYPQVGQVVDWGAFFRSWAVELWVGQWDGYDYNTNNYKLYFNPDTERMELLPWGHDWAFSDWRTWSDPVSVLGVGCLADAACTADFEAVLTDVCATMDDAGVADMVDRAAALIQPYVEADPRRELDPATIQAYQADVKAWAETRSATLLAMFGG